MENLERSKLKRHLEFYKYFFIEKLKSPAVIWRAICNKVENSSDASSSTSFYCDENDAHVADLIYNYIISNQCPVSSMQEFFQLISEASGDKNKTLINIMSMDPETVSIGQLNWEKVVLDLFDDLTVRVDFEELSRVLVAKKIIYGLEQDWIRAEFPENVDRMAQVICLVAQRYSDLNSLQTLLRNLRPKYLTIAKKFSPLSLDEFEWIEIHRDFFIHHAQNICQVAACLKLKNVLTATDLMRLEKLRFSDIKIQSKFLLNTLQRKNGEVRLPLINACKITEGNQNLVPILKFQPYEIVIPYNAFQLLQFNWSQLLAKVSYDRVSIYLVSRDFIKYKEHLQCSTMTTNEEKMQFVLSLVVTREDFYDAFFHIMSLSGRRQLFRNCYPMSFEEKKIILEVQDFLAQEIKHTSEVCEELLKIGVLTFSDVEYIQKMPSTLTKNLAMLTLVKIKSSQGTTLKLLNILWKTRNRNCAEILAVDFSDFQMTIEEWHKLKSNWTEIVKVVNFEHVSSTVLNTGVISEKEHDWIERSPKNRHRMRKLLRILPNKKRGFKILLLAMSQYDEYCQLLLKCQPMELRQLRRLQDNIEFLTENTKNLLKILQELLSREIITTNEAQLITFYEEPIQELYMLLMGKSNGLVNDLIEVLEGTDNLDAATVLHIDPFSLTMNQMEYRDYLRMWFEFLEIQYKEIREYFISSGMISSLEDFCICNGRTNEDQMRMLLQLVPYRQGAFNALVEVMT